MAKADWSPEQYERFRDERAQPFFDLLSLVQPEPNMRVIDLGCGTGELTRLLHQRLAARETLGIDNSEAMLARSRALAGGGLRFELADIADLPPGGDWDLVFSNAALQWLPDHPALFRRLTACLAAGGQLAVQVPANYDHPSHLVAADVAREAPFRDALAGYVRLSPVPSPEEYALLLDRLGYREQHVRLQVYIHHLSSRREVVEWVKGTLLTAYQQRLPPDLYAAFLAEYERRLLPLLDDSHPHTYPFKRILLWGRR